MSDGMVQEHGSALAEGLLLRLALTGKKVYVFEVWTPQGELTMHHLRKLQTFPGLSS